MQKVPYAHCSDCSLKANTLVPTASVKEASLIVLVDNPDIEAMRAGKYLTGNKERVLMATLSASGIDPEAVYITGLVKCWVRGYLQSSDVEACAEALEAELEQINAPYILVLGQSTLEEVHPEGKEASIYTKRGQWFEAFGRQCIATYSPGMVLARPDFYRNFMADVAKVAEGPCTSPVTKAPEVTSIETEADIPTLLATLRWVVNGSWVAFDIESQNLQWYDKPDKPAGKLLCVALAWWQDRAIVIKAEMLDHPEVDQALRSFFCRVRTIAHNGKFDCHYLHNKGYDYFRVDYDTMLGNLTLNELGPHSLKYLASDRFGVPDYEEMLVKKYIKKKKNADYSLIPYPDLIQYAAWDVTITVALHELQTHLIKQEGMYEWPFTKLLMPASTLAYNMERHGFLVDLDHFRKWQNVLQKLVDHVANQIRDMVNLPDLNPASPIQVAKIMYDVLRLPPPKDKRKKPRCTDDEVLKALKGKHPFIDLLKKYRRINKIKGSYIDNIFEFMDTDGRVHASIRLEGAETGRISVTDPALQTLPRASDIYGRVIRSGYISKPGHTLVISDYSQAELRACACLSGDPFLLDVYRTGRDLHTEGTNSMYGTREEIGEQTWDNIRENLIKRFNFGWLYGATADTLVRNAGISRNEALAFVAKYEANMPGATQWKKDSYNSLRKNGYLQTPFGRKRRMPLITEGNKEEAKKMAGNMPLQSIASDLNMLAAIKIDQAGYRVLMLVHDSIILEVPDDWVEDTKAFVKNTMEQIAISFFPQIPWKADVKSGKRWVEAPSDQDMDLLLLESEQEE